MRTFDQIKAGLGFTENKPAPAATYGWYAYKDGQCTVHDSEVVARKMSKNVERFQTNKTETDAYWSVIERENDAIYKVFHWELREEYSELSDAMYILCYSEAYDRGHSSGIDDVVNYMISTVEFAKEIVKAYINE